MKLIGSTKNKMPQNEYGESLPYLEITEIVLVHLQQDSRVLCTFFPNKLFGQLSDKSPKKFIYFITFNSEFTFIRVWLLIKILTH